MTKGPNSISTGLNAGNGKVNSIERACGLGPAGYRAGGRGLQVEAQASRVTCRLICATMRSSVRLGPLIETKEAVMQLAILGTGAVGGTLGRRWAVLGHEVRFGARDPRAAKGRELV